mmetsp:Transcript_35103/g.101106  ORF Transcript_35103/g.101106 Transcript_35103/m.101106 type:complete len:213 (+) Transcript_35103:934-1572(+)
MRYTPPKATIVCAPQLSTSDVGSPWINTFLVSNATSADKSMYSPSGRVKLVEMCVYFSGAVNVMVRRSALTLAMKMRSSSKSTGGAPCMPLPSTCLCGVVVAVIISSSPGIQSTSCCSVMRFEPASAVTARRVQTCMRGAPWMSNVPMLPSSLAPSPFSRIVNCVLDTARHFAPITGNRTASYLLPYSVMMALCMKGFSSVPISKVPPFTQM